MTERLAPGLLAEWDEVHAAVRDRLTTHLRDLGASTRTCDYVGSLRLYLRAPFLLTVWVPDRDERREITVDLAAHVVGMKLFDDLLDADSDLYRYELGGCLPLWHLSLANLCRRAADPNEVLRVVRREFDAICTGQLRTKQEPALNLLEWRRHADTYGGRFLACYGSLAALAGNVRHAYEAATRLGYAFGMIVTIADDLRDYERKGERQGNLGHLLRSGDATPDEVRALVDEMREVGHRAAAHGGAAYDAAPAVDWYADDVQQRILPAVLSA